MNIFNKIRGLYRIIKREYANAPFAFVGKKWSKYVPYHETFYPQYEDNINAVLHVCICGSCEKAKPRLKELAKDFRLNLFYKNPKTKNYESIATLFINNSAPSFARHGMAKYPLTEIQESTMTAVRGR